MFITAILAKLASLRDYLYLALFVALISGFLYYRHSLIVEGEHTEAAAVTVATHKAEAAAALQIAQLTKDHETAVTKVKEDTDEKLKVVSTQHESDAQRLREYDTYRRQHPALPRPASGSGNQATGDGGTVPDDARFASLEQVALGSTTAGRVLAVALAACMTERDDLVGK